MWQWQYMRTTRMTTVALMRQCHCCHPCPCSLPAHTLWVYLLWVQVQVSKGCTCLHPSANLYLPYWVQVFARYGYGYGPRYPGVHLCHFLSVPFFHFLPSSLMTQPMSFSIFSHHSDLHYLAHSLITLPSTSPSFYHIPLGTLPLISCHYLYLTSVSKSSWQLVQRLATRLDCSCQLQSIVISSVASCPVCQKSKRPVVDRSLGPWSPHSGAYTQFFSYFYLFIWIY